MGNQNTTTDRGIVSIAKVGRSPWNGRTWRLAIDTNGTTVLQRYSEAYGWITTSTGDNCERDFEKIVN